MRGQVLTDLPDGRVEEDFQRLGRLVEFAQIERMRRLAELESRQVFARDGHLSAASWLADTQQLTPGEARGQVRLARSLHDMPETSGALDRGEISLSAATILATTREIDPEAFRESESQMVEAARLHRIPELQRVAAFWRALAESRLLSEGEEGARRRRSLHISKTWHGMTRLDGWLDPESAESVMAAINSIMDADARSRGQDDDRTPAQRRADALSEVCDHYLGSSDRPVVAGERPHATITVAMESLAGLEAGATGSMTELPVGLAEFDRGGPVPVEVARRILCDASITRVVLSGESQPLDVGRRTSVVPPSMRRAVVVRDRHCRFPGCDRPHTWCDAHHVVHWSRGGPTAISNLLLLCRRHHRLIHGPSGFGLQMSEGRPHFTRPDGSAMQDRAPP